MLDIPNGHIFQIYLFDVELVLDNVRLYHTYQLGVKHSQDAVSPKRVCSTFACSISNLPWIMSDFPWICIFHIYLLGVKHSPGCYQTFHKHVYCTFTCSMSDFPWMLSNRLKTVNAHRPKIGSRVKDKIFNSWNRFSLSVKNLLRHSPAAITWKNRQK